MLLAGCSKDADISNSTTLSGNGEKTPLLINATLDTGKGQTRAVDNHFDEGDVLYAYVRHMVDADGTGSSYSTLDPTTDYANKTVTITKTNSGFSTDSYWDDFSNSASDDTNIRTTTPNKHGLQAFYGYCYNGRLDSETPAPALTEDTGVLVWSVLQDQSTETKYKHSDLLKAPQTATVNYDHSSGPSGGHGTLELAFTHAMSQISVTVNAGTGFSAGQDPLRSTAITLNNMFTTTQITGPDGSWVDVEGAGDENHKDITMYAKACATGALTREFVAVVAPGTELRVGAQLMNITDVHGNNYIVEITSEMLASSAWGNGVNETTITTQPGYNYNLTVTVMKSSIQASATLAPWNDVNSTGTGAIQFTADVTGTTSSSGFNDASAFSLYWVKHDNSHATPVERTNTAYSYATTPTYNGSNWTNTTPLYWPNKDDSYYFRALADYVNESGSIEVASPLITTTARGNADNKQTNNITKAGYILWGTTAAHNSYALGAAIPPRTGGVPMEFRCVNRSNVKFTLKTATGSAAMPLSEATISISNIYSTGNIILEDGLVEGTGAPTDLAPALTSDGGAGTYSSASISVLAQKISDDAVVTITFTKEAQVYSTYTIPLKKCVESVGSTFIEVWEGGHTYNYTIHVEKEAVKFSAAVKSWATVSGSGTATMVNE